LQVGGLVCGTRVEVWVLKTTAEGVEGVTVVVVRIEAVVVGIEAVVVGTAAVVILAVRVVLLVLRVVVAVEIVAEGN